jgi:hypothetical protein
LLISHTIWLPQFDELVANCLRLSNIAYLKSKNSKNGFELAKRNTFIRRGGVSWRQQTYLSRFKGWIVHSAVDRPVRYEVFGLECPGPVPVQGNASPKPPSAKVAIFPTSALAKKDYPLRAWLWLADHLAKDEWTVDFVCLPKEQAVVQKVCMNFAVRSFPDIKELMDYLSDCAAVISNDSGGGHLASLMGKKTFTITRRKGSFSWRPGFNELNYVLAPLIRLKLFGRYIWWPFIPIWRIPARLGKAPDKSLA